MNLKKFYNSRIPQWSVDNQLPDVISDNQWGIEWDKAHDDDGGNFFGGLSWNFFYEHVTEMSRISNKT